MNNRLLISTIFATLGLAACDKQPTVVNAPATPVTAPGSPGSPGVVDNPGGQGMQGAQGVEGSKVDPGKTDNSAAVIISPPASAAVN